MDIQTTSSDLYDAIVIGARCAGSPTAMLLARQGYRVLLLIRINLRKDEFPKGKRETHLGEPRRKKLTDLRSSGMIKVRKPLSKL